jgi:LmbE family N-acetylglucosaminyl deacetylase
MPSALAVVAHHDDHILWMGGAIQRTRQLGWDWTLIAMCVPTAHEPYFRNCSAALGFPGLPMVFEDYMGAPQSQPNSKTQMERDLLNAVQGKAFDWVFTHSRYAHGEYGGAHANHVEVGEVVRSLVASGRLGKGLGSIAYFSYDIIYGGGGKATVAKKDPPNEGLFFVQLTYPELLLKCQWCQKAPDLSTSLKNLGFPCPNPEAFEGDGLALPSPFIGK